MESLAQSPQLPDVSQQVKQQMAQGMQPPTSTVATKTTIELKDIHLPEQITDYPIAYGWWIVAVILIFAVVTAMIKYRAYLKVRIDQKYAIIKMQESVSLDESIKILKWAAIQYFPRHQIANLYGLQFQQFLTNKLAKNQQTEFAKLSAPAFESLYKNLAEQNNVNQINEHLNQASILWLKNALPPNKKLTQGESQ